MERESKAADRDKAECLCTTHPTIHEYAWNQYGSLIATILKGILGVGELSCCKPQLGSPLLVVECQCEHRVQ